jgi:hypothetical protein
LTARNPCSLYRAGALQKGVYESGLADARLADNETDLTLAGEGLVKSAPQLTKFRLAAARLP